MADPKSINLAALEQTQIALYSIADLADTVRGLCSGLIEEVTGEEPTSRLVAARELASQIGLIADVAGEKLGSNVYGPLKGTSPADWLLPPAYHAAKEEANHG